MSTPPLREIAGPAGRLEALLERPVHSGVPLRAAVVFAHPHPLHGGTMHTKAVYRATKALAGLGCAVLRFNFRGVGQSEGTFDNAVGELDDFRAGLDFMAVAVSRRGPVGGRILVRRLRCAHGRRSRRPCLDADRHRAGAAHVQTSPGWPRAAKPSTSCRASGTRSARSRTCRRSSRASANRSSSSWCQVRTICSTDRSKRSAVRSPGCSQTHQDVRTHEMRGTRAERRPSPGASTRLSRGGRIRSRKGAMQDAVIVSAVRTAVGKAPAGTLRATRPDEMAGGRAARGARARARRWTRPRSTT